MTCLRARLWRVKKTAALVCAAVVTSTCINRRRCDGYDKEKPISKELPYQPDQASHYPADHHHKHDAKYQ